MRWEPETYSKRGAMLLLMDDGCPTGVKVFPKGDNTGWWAGNVCKAYPTKEEAMAMALVHYKMGG